MHLRLGSVPHAPPNPAPPPLHLQIHYEGGGSRTAATDVICPMYARVHQIQQLADDPGGPPSPLRCPRRLALFGFLNRCSASMRALRAGAGWATPLRGVARLCHLSIPPPPPLPAPPFPSRAGEARLVILRKQHKHTLPDPCHAAPPG